MESSPTSDIALLRRLLKLTIATASEAIIGMELLSQSLKQRHLVRQMQLLAPIMREQSKFPG